jgi:hypothetical protein
VLLSSPDASALIQAAVCSPTGPNRILSNRGLPVVAFCTKGKTGPGDVILAMSTAVAQFPRIVATSSVDWIAAGPHL